MRKRVFIAQPFDGQKYDKRYKDVYEPTIKKAGFEPYRVDRDPTASIPIDEIQRNIEDAIFVFSDVSEDNPNVWFEVGFAIAKGKEVCFVCARDRLTKDRKFPFDIQHRSIIVYDSVSRSDWDDLETRITERMHGIQKRLDKNSEIQNALVVRRIDGGAPNLSDLELAAFGIIAAAVPANSGISVASYNDKMDQQGYTGIAANYALRGLLRENLIEEFKEFDSYSEFYYPWLRITEAGWNFLDINHSTFEMRKSPSVEQKSPYSAVHIDDEIPF